MFYDRVSFTTATTGTGTITVGSAESGFLTPAQALIDDGEVIDYAIVDGAAWETGRGVIGASATTMTRVLSVSSTGSLLNLSGSARCFFTPIAETMNDIADRRIVGQTSAPSSPAAGSIKTFALDLGGVILPSTIGSDGLIRVLTPESLNRSSLVATPASGTTMNNSGGTLTLSGSISHPAIASTSYFTSHLRTRFSSNTTPGNTAGWRNNSVGECMRTYGFLLNNRFSISNLVAGHRFFNGLSNSIGAPSNIDPLTDTTIAKIGVGFNTNSGNLFIIHGPAGSSPTTIDLGSSFPVNTTDAYDLFLYAPPNGNITYVVAKLSATDGSWTHVSSGTLSTNLPSATTSLLRYGMCTNNAAAASASADVTQIGLWRL